MNNNTKLLLARAKKLQLPIRQFSPGSNLFRVELGKAPYYFYSILHPFNKGSNVYIARNKYACNQRLEKHGFEVPTSIHLTQEEWTQGSLLSKLSTLSYPLVVKPVKNAGRGKDVLCNIKNIETLNGYLEDFFQVYPEVIIQTFHRYSKEYRVLIFSNKVIGVVERTAAQVVGDGKSTISELIDAKNRLRVELAKTLLVSPIEVDIEYIACLKDQNLTLNSIPTKGETVQLCYTVNTGRGGDTRSLGKSIHPKNAKILCKAAKVLNLNYVGLDVICDDIQKPFKDHNWKIIEANYVSDLTIHENAQRGVPTAVTRILLFSLIKKHPLSYIYHLLTKSKLAKWLKGVLVVGLILGLAYYVYP